MAEETKKDQRVKAPVLRAKYKSRTLDEFIEKYSRDISRSGMWIKSGKPPALGTLLKVEILLDDSTPVIAAVGRVVKRREEAEASPDNPAGMGIRFLKIEESSQPVIERIVALKGEDAGPHFENIRTGATVPPTSTGESNSAFFGATNPAKDMPPDADRTMMRQMNALLGEALRQVNASPMPTQKATIMGLAAPAGMLEQALAISREEGKKGEEGKKADDAPTKVATRSEIDTAIEKSKTVEDPAEVAKAEAKKPEAPKVEAKKPEAPKVEAPKVEAPKVEAPKVEAPKAEVKKPEAPKADPLRAEVKKPEAPKAETAKPLQPKYTPPGPRSLTTRTGSIPPPPSTRPIELETAKVESQPPVESKKAAEPAKLDGPKPDEAPSEAAKVEELKVEELKAEEPKVEEPKAEEPKAEAKLDEAKADEKPAEEAKAEGDAKVDEKLATELAEKKPADEKPADVKHDEAKLLVVTPDEKKPADEKPVVAKVDEKPVVAKKPDEKKPDEKKPAPPAEPEGNAMSSLITVAVIAALAFAVYWFLMRGDAGQHPGLDAPGAVSALLKSVSRG